MPPIPVSRGLMTAPQDRRGDRLVLGATASCTRGRAAGFLLLHQTQENPP
jgi:hypothetical protein